MFSKQNVGGEKNKKACFGTQSWPSSPKENGIIRLCQEVSNLCPFLKLLKAALYLSRAKSRRFRASTFSLCGYSVWTRPRRPENGKLPDSGKPVYSAHGRVWLRNCPKAAFASNPGGPCLSRITIFRALCLSWPRACCTHCPTHLPGLLVCKSAILLGKSFPEHWGVVRPAKSFGRTPVPSLRTPLAPSPALGRSVSCSDKGRLSVPTRGRPPGHDNVLQSAHEGVCPGS